MTNGDLIVNSGSLSRELQVGKAGEHFVCFDLISQGYNAFLADQGLPYDVLVDIGESIVRVQVKATQSIKDYERAAGVYRFGTRRSKGNRTRVIHGTVDVFAFVALDIKVVAYWTTEQATARTGAIKQTIDFKTHARQYTFKLRNNGEYRRGGWGNNFIEDFQHFPIEVFR